MAVVIGVGRNPLVVSQVPMEAPNGAFGTSRGSLVGEVRLNSWDS